ncbi:MAG: hypothetical protein CL610_18195 [Anaerolineaceae bacterium]|nr:hypothetical protein [Anaerolineaceae bacterium]
MATSIQTDQDIPGVVVARDVTFEEYLERYAASYCELVGSVVRNMSPIHERHDRLTRYIATLLEAYFELRPIGRILQAPFVMRLQAAEVAREPDIQVILHDNPYALTPTFMDGPADIAIEIVSPESVERDHGQKFVEYEKGGVREYWIIDPLRSEARFYQLDAEGIYRPQYDYTDDHYTTPLMPGLQIHVATLWATTLPGPAKISHIIQEMLQA